MHRLDAAVPNLPVNDDAVVGSNRSIGAPISTPEGEIVRLLEVTKTFESHLAPLRALSLYTMILLIYCAGLRIGELARLTLADLDLERDTIEICGTKFFNRGVYP